MYKTLLSITLLLLCQIAYCQTGFDEKDYNKKLKKLKAKEWQILFNGQDFEGWDQREGKAPFTIENQVLTGTAKAGTPSSFLCTKKEYDDFILELDFKVDRWMNSGIQIRSHSLPDFKNGEVHGYQVEIDASERAWTGGIYDQSRRGWIADLQENEAARNAFKADDWNHFRIEAVGPRIRTWINGVPAADLVDNEDATGFIALQVHLTHDNGTRAVKPGAQVHWKNIKIKSLD